MVQEFFKDWYKLEVYIYVYTQNMYSTAFGQFTILINGYNQYNVFRMHLNVWL